MNYRKLAVAATSVVVMALMGGTAVAQPAVASAAAPEIHYNAAVRDKSVVFSIDAGSLTVRDKHLEILDDQGNEVAVVPLTYRLDNFDHPIAAAITDRTVVLTPDADPAVATPAADVARDGVVSVDGALTQVAATYPSADARSADALGTLVQQLTVGSMLSAMVGTVVGAGIGCVAGLVVGAAATTPVAWLLGVGPIAGCVGGAILFGSIAAIGGTLLIGGPIAVGALFQYFQTLNAPIVPSAKPTS
ncbi:hypothetical protein [Nocardia abscessus]|uniref:hypothetical protein n=1 Tax=Nocardia abscessus TaxID=120957 RepID=UPI0024583E52|nr:hypothetical protein [Nocardia abscessus]